MHSAREVQPHWHVLGAGAIGCLFAQALGRSGCKVTLLLRPEATPRDILIEIDEDSSRLEASQQAVDADTPISYLLVTTKAYDVRVAVNAVADRLQPQAPVVILVNGMGLQEELLADHPQLTVFPGTTTEGAHRPHSQHVRHAGRGTTRIGGGNLHRPPHWFAPFKRSGMHCLWEAAIEESLWHKLAINCAINPLTALHRCHNGELGRDAALRREVAALCGEIEQISYAAGYTRTAQTLQTQVFDVIRSTGDNRSSMLQDVEAGRRTEINYITGYLLDVAARHGIPAPRNNAVLEEVRALAP